MGHFQRHHHLENTFESYQARESNAVYATKGRNLRKEKDDQNDVCEVYRVYMESAFPSISDSIT